MVVLHGFDGLVVVWLVILFEQLSFKLSLVSTIADAQSFQEVWCIVSATVVA